MVSSSLASQAYVFDPRPHYPLRIALKRYWKASSPDAQDPDALTLIFTHGTGFHKEQWEPTIDDLYSLFNGKESVKIRDVFAIDMANHGDSAILNEKELLGERYNPICTCDAKCGGDTLNTEYAIGAWEEYARSIHACLAGLGTGLDVDFSKRRLVGIGHSMGAVSLCVVVFSTAMINSTYSQYYVPQLPTRSQIRISHLRGAHVHGREVYGEAFCDARWRRSKP